MHSGIGESLESHFGVFGIIDDAGYDHRRRAILEQIDFPGKGCVGVLDIVQQIVNRPCDTMALGLAGNDNSVEC